jgi:hypothetical protein
MPGGMLISTHPWEAIVRCELLVTAALVSTFMWARPLQAADFACPAGDVACLIAAIQTANTNGETNTITLADGPYILP